MSHHWDSLILNKDCDGCEHLQTHASPSPHCHRLQPRRTLKTILGPILRCLTLMPSEENFLSQIPISGFFLSSLTLTRKFFEEISLQLSLQSYQQHIAYLLVVVLKQKVTISVPSHSLHDRFLYLFLGQATTSTMFFNSIFRQLFHEFW